MTAVTGIPPDLLQKFIVRTTVWIVFLAIVLFGAAGFEHRPEVGSHTPAT